MLAVGNNTISGLASPVSCTGIAITTGASVDVFNNAINGLATAGACTGLSLNVVTGGATENVFGNVINGLATSGTCTGMSLSGSTTLNVFKNKIYDVVSSGVLGNGDRGVA